MQLATALLSTTDRYTRGAIVRSTWKAHMDHLWARIDQLRLRARVVRLLGIKTNSLHLGGPQFRGRRAGSI